MRVCSAYGGRAHEEQRAARREGVGGTRNTAHTDPHEDTQTSARTYARAHHARSHARLHAPHPRCSGSGDHDGGCGRRLGARVAAAASVAAVMGGRRRGRHGRVWHGRMRCGTGVAAVATVEVAGSPAATAVEVTVAARSATATTDAARRPGRDVLLLDTCGNG